MSNPIEPILEQLRDQIVEASTHDITRTVEDARQESLAEFKALLTERLFQGVFEYAQDVPAPSGSGLPPAGGLSSGEAADLDEEVAEPETVAHFDVDDPAALEIEEPDDVPAADLPEDSVFAPVQPDDLLLDDEQEAAALQEEVSTLEEKANALEEQTHALDGEDVDPEILEEIEAIRQQISRNEQLLGQLKPFFSGQESGHA